jgi:hypothetical protein
MNREIFFEMKRIGSVMRVTAIDAATGREVVIQGPANTSQRELQRLAIAKLEYVMKNKKN